MPDYDSCPSKKARKSSSRETGRRGRRTPHADRPHDNAVAEFALHCRCPREWNFEGDNLIPVLITQLPGWRTSGLLLEILQQRYPVVQIPDKEHFDVRAVIRLRKTTNNHYRAIVNNVEVDLGPDGNCFFYSIWYALENCVSPEIRQKLYGTKLPRDRAEASSFFRNQIADYVLDHSDEIRAFLGSSRFDGNANTDKNQANTAPFVLTEIARSLFHAGKSLSFAFGSSLLTGEGLILLCRSLPLSYLPIQIYSLYNQIYSLYNALVNDRGRISGFLTLLSLLPYNALSSEHFIFSMADAARETFLPSLPGTDELPSFFWIKLGTLLVLTHYALGIQENVELPQTAAGRALTAFFQQFSHIPRLLGLLETIHASRPLSDASLPEPPFGHPNDTDLYEEVHTPNDAQSAFAFISTPWETMPSIPLLIPDATDEYSEPYFLQEDLYETAEANHLSDKTDHEQSDSSPTRDEAYFGSHVQHSASSSAPETAPCLLSFLIAIGYIVPGIPNEVSPRLRRTVIAATATIITTAISAYLAQLVWTLRKESDDTNPENLRSLPADAQALSQEHSYGNADMYTPGSKWLYLKGKNWHCVQHIIETQFDHGYLEDALEGVFGPDRSDRADESETMIYDSAVRRAWKDYASEINTHLRDRSSENRYGKELYAILEQTDTGYNCAPEILRRLKIVLIKIKTYETFIFRERKNLPFDQKDGPFIKLESIFDLPIELPRQIISPGALDEYTNVRLGYPSTADTPIEVKNGAHMAVFLWGNQIKKFLDEKKPEIPEIAISTARQLIQDKIRQIKEEIYIRRGPRDLPLLAQSKSELVEYYYASHHLESLIISSHNYLKVLETISPILKEEEHNIKTLDFGNAAALYARAMGIKAAIKIINNHNKTKKFTNNASLNNLSISDYLNNYPLIISSSAEITTFSTLAEALFYDAVKSHDINNLHLAAANPTVLISAFNKSLNNTVFNSLDQKLATEGVEFIKNIVTSDKTSSDTEYYQQFITFQSKYQNPFAKTISYQSLLEYGMHPYEMLTKKPLRVVQLSMYARGKLQQSQTRLTYGHAFLMFLNSFSDNTKFKTTYGKSGELTFCKMSESNWLVILTFGGSCLIRSITETMMRQNPALSAILFEQGAETPDIDLALLLYFSDTVPDGSNELWMDNNIIDLIINPIFGEESPVNKDSFEKGYLSLNGNAGRRFSNTNIFDITNQIMDDTLTVLIEQAKEGKYLKNGWQVLASMIVWYDILNRLHHDPSYTPSAWDIATEAFSTFLIILSVGIFTGRLSLKSASILRNSILKHKTLGLSGKSLISAVMADVSSDLADFPLVVIYRMGYEIFSIWEPLPLDEISRSLFKKIRKFQFTSLIRSTKPKDIPNLTAVKIDEKFPDAAAPGKPASADAKGVLIATNKESVQYYEYSYSYTRDTLLGRGEQPDVKLAEPARHNPAIAPADVHELNSKGAIELNPSRAIKRVETPFRYSRADTSVSPDAVSSLGNDGRHLSFEFVEQGIARNIDFHRLPPSLSGYNENMGISEATEIIYLREPTDSVVGIRIDLEDIAVDRPLLVTSGDMSGGSFLAGIDSVGASIYLYRFGNVGGNLADLSADNLVIRQLFETHNSLANRAEIRISVPGHVQATDMHWFSKKFDKATMTYADYPQANRFAVLDPELDFSAEPGVQPVANHFGSSSNLDLINYNRISSDENIIKSSGNVYYLISRTSDNRVIFSGSAQYRSSMDTNKIKPWQPDATKSNEWGVELSDIKQIEELLISPVNPANTYARASEPDYFKIVQTTADYFLTNGYNVRYRIAFIYPHKMDDKIFQHPVVSVEKNGRTYIVDIGANQFASQGIDQPIYSTDFSWRSQYVSAFPDSIVLIRETDNFEALKTFSENRPDRENLALTFLNPEWTFVNKPTWMDGEKFDITGAMNIDATVSIDASRTQRAYIDLNSPEMPASSFQAHLAKWNRVTTDPAFANALTGSPSAVAEKIHTLLKQKDINSKIIITRTYENFYDENPAVNYAIEAEFQKSAAHIVTLTPDSLGNAFTAQIISLQRWQRENQRKATFFRLIDDPQTMTDFLDTPVASRRMGQSAFFNQMNNRYSVLHFDADLLPALDSAINNNRAELSRYSGPYLGNDLETERLILEKYKSIEPDNQMNIRVQQTRIDEISNYQFLRGSLGRLEDLRGKISGASPSEIRPTGNPGKRMIRKIDDLKLHYFGNNLFNKILIRKYDSLTGNYLRDAGFSVVSIPNLRYLFGEIELKSILSEYLTFYREIHSMAISYSSEGRMVEGQGIVKNAYIGIEMTERLIRYSGLEYTDNIYALIDRANFNFQTPEAYGLSLISNVRKNDEIVHLDTVVAHPFTQLRNKQDFVDYAIRHGATWDRRQLEKYKIGGAGQFLSYQTAKTAISLFKPKYLSVQTRTPRAENIASALGLREMNDLEFYGLDATRQSEKDARTSLLRSIFKTFTFNREHNPFSEFDYAQNYAPKPVPPAVAEPEAAVAPIGSQNKLNIRWRREDISLAPDRPGAAGDKFEGVYSVPVAGTSHSTDWLKYYIMEENNVYEVRLNDDGDMWRIVDPLDPGTFGNGPLVKLDDTGHWSLVGNLPVRDSSPVLESAKVGHLVNLSLHESLEIREVLRRGRKRAIKHIKSAQNALQQKKATESADEAFDMFFGRHNDVVKEKYRKILSDISTFLNEIDITENVSYKSGYFGNKDTLMYTKVGAFSTKSWKEGQPVVLVSVDALVDATSRTSFTSAEFDNYVACLLIHESYHAVSTTAADFRYPRISNRAMDISPLVAIPNPVLFDGDLEKIRQIYGKDIAQSDVIDLQQKAMKRAFNNPDNLAYLTLFLSDFYNKRPQYRKISESYTRWSEDQSLMLAWEDGPGKGRIFQPKTRTAMGSITNGNPDVLTRNGLMYRTSSSKIPVHVDFVTPESSALQTFDVENPAHSVFVDTWQGGKTTSLKNGIWSGRWGREDFLNNDLSVIEVSGQKSAITAVRIELDQITETHPVVVSGGELDTPTIVFALSRDGEKTYLYVFHMGNQIDRQGLPTLQGIAGIYRAHLLMGGEPLEGTRISGNILLDRNELPLDHRALDRILGTYTEGFVAYSAGSRDSAPRAGTGKPAQWVNYASGSSPGKGYAYALASRPDKHGPVSIQFRAGAVSAPQTGGPLKPKSSGQ